MTFNADLPLQQLVKQIVSDNDVELFIETGTYHGDTAMWIARELKILVATVDINNSYRLIARNRFITSESDKRGKLNRSMGKL